MLISPALLFLQADRSGLPLFCPRDLIPGAAIHSCPVRRPLSSVYSARRPKYGCRCSVRPFRNAAGRGIRAVPASSCKPLAVDEHRRMAPYAAFLALQVGIVGDRRLEPGVDTPPAGLVAVLHPFVSDELVVALAVGRIDEDVVLPVQQRVVSQPVGQQYPCLFFST